MLFFTKICDSEQKELISVVVFDVIKQHLEVTQSVISISILHCVTIISSTETLTYFYKLIYNLHVYVSLHV